MPTSKLGLTYTEDVCLSPSGLAVSNITENSSTLGWTENGDANAWVLQYGTDSEFATYTEENVSTTPSFDFTGLTAGTTYYVRVKPACDTDGSHWSNTLNFTTAEAVGNSWSDDFEGESCGWEFVNGTLTNNWVWGTATNNGGTHALYVSNDGGTTNAYTFNGTTTIYATKLLIFTEGEYNFSYDWKANGESAYDYLRVALVPVSETLTAGTSAPSGFGTGGNKLTYPANDGYIYGFRAYFQLTGDAVAEARAFRMSFGEETGIKDIYDLQIDDLRFASGTYTLDGRRIQGQPTQKGLYIVKGKKTIIK